MTKLVRRKRISSKELARRHAQREASMPKIIAPKYVDHSWSTWNRYLTNASTASGNYYYANNYANSTASTWTEWNSAYSTTPIYVTASSNVSIEDSWYAWNGSYTMKYSARGGGSFLRPELTPEERQAQEQRREAQRVAAEARRIEREEAHARAEKLLLENLTEEQRKEYRELGQFHITSQTGRRYCILRGRQHNIFEVDATTGRRLRELCGHVRDDVPNPDNVLAQKLALEFMEADFLRTCNIWDLTVPHRPVISREGEDVGGRLLAVA